MKKKKQLNKENKNKVMDILNTVSENINQSEIDFANTETETTLSSLESFMSMNGWQKGFIMKKHEIMKK